MCRCLRLHGMSVRRVWLVVGALCISSALRAQPTAPAIELTGLAVKPTGLVEIRYRVGGQAETREVPAEVLTGLVAQMRLAEAAPPPDAAALPADSAVVRRGEIFMEVEGIPYRILIETDRLVEIRRTVAGREEVVRYPPALVLHVARHYSVLHGEQPQFSDVYVDAEEGKLWFQISRTLPLWLLLAVVGLVPMGATFVAMRGRARRAERERDELVASRHRLMQAREEERSHLAAELHDGPLQEVQRVLRTYLLPQHRPEAEAATERQEAQTALQQVAADLRGLCTELRPPVLVHFGLDKALQTYARHFQERHADLRIDLDLDAEQKLLPLDVRLVLFRMVQEGLNNVAKHAGATEVQVVFRLDAHQLALELRDNGRGFTPPKRWLDLEAQGHLGLSGLAERVAAIGGHLHVSSAPGTGTTLRIEAPRPSVAPPDPETTESPHA